ncbi:hypothetical protein GOBAR_AA19635 [Gossypium barbadense]|uniref:Uncharacterized protein n=1 Tax=Gossypium barbadense TaxID=3634 RepID=A0A2P5XCJ1_GOSBA|nr:hypothetical protein GOBAR_AA19635 [Gossypium barbadense]
MQWTKLLLLPIPSSSSTFQSGASSKLRFLSTSIAATFGIPYLKNTYCFCQRPSLANWCPTSLADLFTCIKADILEESVPSLVAFFITVRESPFNLRLL